MGLGLFAVGVALTSWSCLMPAVSQIQANVNDQWRRLQETGAIVVDPAKLAAAGGPTSRRESAFDGFFMFRGPSNEDWRTNIYGAHGWACGILAVYGIGMIAWGVRQRNRDAPQPR